MSFEVAADAYGRFMGRYAEPLATAFVELAGLPERVPGGGDRVEQSRPGGRALDVGCGTGVLTAELVERLGAGAVAAIDPSEMFVAAARSRFPTVDIRRAGAEALPFADGTFDYVFAQLVVHFMTDPVAGVREMARVAKPGRVVAACVWDHAGGRGPVSLFWRAVRELDPSVQDESGLAGAREGHLAELFAAAGLKNSRSSLLTVRATFADFDEWWEAYLLGVGPAGDYVRGLDADRTEKLRKKCAAMLPPDGPIELTASAWAAVGKS